MYSIVLNRDPYKDKYLKLYGKHFNEKLCNFAVERMDHSSFKPWTKDEVLNLLNSHGITINNYHLYDIVYVANMAKSDFLSKSLIDVLRVAQYVKDYLDDEDGYESIAFCRFLADCKAKNVKINWRDMI